MQFITLDIKKTDSTKQEIKRFNFSKHMSSWNCWECKLKGV